MLEFSAHRFHHAGSTLGWIKHVVASKIETGSLDSDSVSRIALGFKSLSETLRSVGCSVSGGIALTLSLDLENEMVSGEVLKGKIEVLQEAISREMQGHLFLWVTTHKVEYYQKKTEELVSEAFVKNFPIASREFQEGCKCYACDFPTAAVFHFMRVLDSGIQAFGNLIEHDSSSNKNWGKVFEKFDKDLKTAPNERPQVWKENGAFLEHIAASFKAVQKAWRNPTMHLEKTYSDAQALEILSAISAFMRELSERMNERGELL